MDSYDLVEFATVWTNLGDAIQKQVKAVLRERNPEVNDLAIHYAISLFEPIASYDEESPVHEIVRELKEHLTAAHVREQLLKPICITCKEVIDKPQDAQLDSSSGGMHHRFCDAN
jgi:hypothetical protein